MIPIFIAPLTVHEKPYPTKREAEKGLRAAAKAIGKTEERWRRLVLATIQSELIKK